LQRARSQEDVDQANIFLASSALQFAISVIGVVIFAGLTAYDTQKLKDRRRSRRR
jgi:FtsH-binding integral membrane protein